MADKAFYLSEFAFEMLIMSQNIEKVIIPIPEIVGKAEPESLYSELYSLVVNNIVINNAETACFDINEELVPIFKSIFSSKAVLRVTGRSKCNIFSYYYLSPYGIAELKNNCVRKSIRLRHLNDNELYDSIISNLILPRNYKNHNTDTDAFISSVDECFANSGDFIETKMLNKSVDELEEQIERSIGFVDLISRDNLNVISRIVVYKKSIYYKIAQITEENVLISNYSRINFNKAIEKMMGDFL